MRVRNPLLREYSTDNADTGPVGPTIRLAERVQSDWKRPLRADVTFSYVGLVLAVTIE